MNWPPLRCWPSPTVVDVEGADPDHVTVYFTGEVDAADADPTKLLIDGVPGNSATFVGDDDSFLVGGPWSLGGGEAFQILAGFFPGQPPITGTVT